MKRRDFVFQTLPSFLLFSSVFDIRRAEAQIAPRILPFFFVDGGSPYPVPEDFFPAVGSNGAFTLPVITEVFNSLKSDMVIVDGINMDSAGRLSGDNHPCSVSKVLTAAAPIRTEGENSVPGGPSIDAVIAQGLGLRSVQVLCNNQVKNNNRERPFASAREKYILPIRSAVDVFDVLFKDCQPAELDGDGAAVKQARINRLKAKQSILDGITNDLKRLRLELVGVEKVKLDSHEDAIRSVELDLTSEIKSAEEMPMEESTSNSLKVDCSRPANISGRSIPEQSKAHFDVLYAAIKANRTDVIGMMHGYSSTKWGYNWLNVVLGGGNNEHDDIFHRVGNNNDQFIKIARWKWGELAKFAERLKNEPGGSLLDRVLIYATSHFGRHHTIERTPVITLGNAGGRLTTGRSIKVDSYNDKILTSVAHLCGHKISGIGNNKNCGKLSQFY